MRLLPFAIAILLSMPTAPAQNASGAAQTTSDAEATTLRD
jgi:hypothetical protein